VKTHKGAGSSHHRSGRNQTSFRGTPTSNESILHCTYCNQDHHIVNHCYKLHGYPPGHKLYRGGSNPHGHANTRSTSHNGSRNKWRTSSPYAHQVQTTPATAAAQTEQSSSHVDPSTQNLKNILDGLSEDQCKQLAAALVHLSNPTSKNTDVFANAAGLPNSLPANSILPHSWILDSGATDHISSDSSLFIHYNTSRMPCVNLPTGSSVPINSTGTILFNKNITLDNVLHVLSFRLNLMFASKLIKSLHCCIILFPDFCVIQDLATGKMIGWGKQDGGLYYMSSVSQAPISCHVTPFVHSLASKTWVSFTCSSQVTFFLYPFHVCFL
jgi:hypothetical protein